MPLTAQALLDNLEDAGCDSKFVERFLALEQSGQYREQLRLLSDHRQAASGLPAPGGAADRLPGLSGLSAGESAAPENLETP